MITGSDRLRAALTGTPCDRIPVFCNLLDQGAREMGVSLAEYYANPVCVAEAQLLMRARYGYDNLWSLFFVGKEAEFFGCREFLFAEDGPPNVADYVIKEWDDIRRLEVPEDVAGHPAFAPVAENLRILRKATHGRQPICAYVTAASCLPVLLMGMESWMELLMMGPVELRDELLAKCSLFFAREVAAYRAAGADVLVYSTPFGSLDMATPKLFRDVIMPSMVRDLAPGGTAGVVYYAGSARVTRVVEAVMDQLGVTCFYLSPLEDVAAAKALIGERGLTCGAVNDIEMVHWSEQRVREETARIVDAGKPGGRFLFGTVVMPMAIPEANIRAMLETAFERGRLDQGGAR